MPLVTCPFRAYLHLATDGERLDALAAARRLLLPGGRLVFDVFAPGAGDVEETHDRWLEREPGIWERARWDREQRTLTLSVKDDTAATTMTLAWLDASEWEQLIHDCGLVVEATYGWFDRRPYRGQEDVVFVARRPG